jgi:hypothetical protein
MVDVFPVNAVSTREQGQAVQPTNGTRVLGKVWLGIQLCHANSCGKSDNAIGGVVLSLDRNTLHVRVHESGEHPDLRFTRLMNIPPQFGKIDEKQRVREGLCKPEVAGSSPAGSTTRSTMGAVGYMDPSSLLATFSIAGAVGVPSSQALKAKPAMRGSKSSARMIFMARLRDGVSWSSSVDS